MHRILVVDDEAGVRETLTVLFRRAGHEVTSAGGVRAALETIQKADPFDVVITDLSMPDGSGMDVLQGATDRDTETQVVMIHRVCHHRPSGRSDA